MHYSRVFLFMIVLFLLLNHSPSVGAQGSYLDGAVTDHFTIERHRVLALQNNDDVNSQGVNTVRVTPPRPHLATDVVPICTVSSYWMADEHDDVSWWCRWDPSAGAFQLAAYRGDHAGDYVDFTVMLLDAAVFQPVERQFFAACGTQSVNVALSQPTERLVPILAITEYESGTDNDYLFFLEGTLTDFALHTARGNADSCVRGFAHYLSLSEEMAAVWSVYTTPSAAQSSGSATMTIDPQADLLAFSSLIGYQTGPIGVEKPDMFSSEVRSIEGGFEVDVTFILDFSDSQYDDDFSARSSVSTAGSNLVFDFETGIGNATTRAAWLTYALQQAPLAELNGLGEGATPGPADGDAAPRPSNDTVVYSGEQGLSGYEVTPSGTLEIEPSAGNGVLKVINPGGIWYEVHDANQEIGRAPNQEYVWDVAPGAYHIINAEVTIAEATVSAGQQTNLELPSGTAIVTNPGGVWYEVHSIDTDREIGRAPNQEYNWPLLSGDYYIVQGGRRVLDFTITRRRVAEITLDTGTAMITNPGGVWYEVHSIDTDREIGRAPNQEYTWPLRAGDYAVVSAGETLATFAVMFDTTTTLTLNSGQAIVTNPGGVWYEVHDADTGREIGRAPNQEYTWPLLAGNYTIVSAGETLATFSVSTGQTTEVSLGG